MLAKPPKTPCPPETPAPPCGPQFSFRPRCRRRILSPSGGATLTRQEFKNDCDINLILKKFQVSGALSHFAKFSPTYGDFTACDYQTAQNLIIRARQLFDALPSAVRREVSSPEGFLAFVQDPKNAARMVELGLSNKPPPPAPASSGAPTGAPNAAPAA